MTILIVGLGNPGAEYRNTRHNVGFMAVDKIASYLNLDFASKQKFDSEIASGKVSFKSDSSSKDEVFKGKSKTLHENLILSKPSSFMNLSGKPVSSISSFYKILPEDVIVIHDDIDLPLGKIKCKNNCSAGGHNGLRSIDSMIGKNYHRIKIGVGRPENKNIPVADYVLQKFLNSEELILQDKFRFLIENFDLILSKNFEKLQSIKN